MILDKFIEIKWNYQNKKYFVNKGYNFTKINDILIVKISDLNKGSSVNVRVGCDICNRILIMPFWIYHRNSNVGDYFACSRKCATNKIKKTNLEKYGVENISQNNEIKNKKKNNSIEKYGVENVLQSEEIKNKIKQTNLVKYGVEYNSQCDKIKKKKIETNLRKYDVKYSIQNIEILTKIKNTNIERYGFENVFQNQDIINKIAQTTINKYGELWSKLVPKYNPNSIIYLDMISERLGLPIQHALNGGEKKFVKYWVDGYIDEYNICIEWDEKHHNFTKYKEKDLMREEYLKENFGCNIIRINEIEFMKNIGYYINIITKKIEIIVSNQEKIIKESLNII